MFLHFMIHVHKFSTNKNRMNKKLNLFAVVGCCLFKKKRLKYFQVSIFNIFLKSILFIYYKQSPLSEPACFIIWFSSTLHTLINHLHTSFPGKCASGTQWSISQRCLTSASSKSVFSLFETGISVSIRLLGSTGSCHLSLMDSIQNQIRICAHLASLSSWAWGVWL